MGSKAYEVSPGFNRSESMTDANENLILEQDERRRGTGYLICGPAVTLHL